MKILITGGAGFMGSHLSEKYVKEQHMVLCLDNFMNGDPMNVRHLLDYRNFQLINGDIRDLGLLEKIMRNVDVVFHLAAQIHVDRSVVEPKITYEVNVLGTQNILEVARTYGVKRVIHASTGEVYGSAQYVPMDENHPLNAPHPYGASKIAADRLCHAYIQTYDMDINIMRPFNVFGTRQKDSGYGSAIAMFVKRVLSGMPPLVYGDGSQTRDYTYIKDIVHAFDLALRRNEPVREPVNFGGGRETKIYDLASKIIELCNKDGDIEPIHVDKRRGEVQRSVADISRAKQLFGWAPKYRLEDGLKEFIGWYINYRSEERA